MDSWDGWDRGRSPATQLEEAHLEDGKERKSRSGIHGQLVEWRLEERFEEREGEAHHHHHHSRSSSSNSSNSSRDLEGVHPVLVKNRAEALPGPANKQTAPLARRDRACPRDDKKGEAHILCT
jgi:hypothetical protein